MTLQYLFVGLVVAACVAYCVWRIARAFKTKSSDACHGCALKDACQKHRPTTKEKCHDGCRGNSGVCILLLLISEVCSSYA